MPRPFVRFPIIAKQRDVQKKYIEECVYAKQRRSDEEENVCRNEGSLTDIGFNVAFVHTYIKKTKNT